MKLCPRCKHHTLKSAGKIPVGPRKGLRAVYFCTRCGYRGIY